MCSDKEQNDSIKNYSVVFFFPVSRHLAMVSHCWSSKRSFPARRHKDVPRVERLLVPFAIIVPTQAPGDLLDGRKITQIIW